MSGAYGPTYSCLSSPKPSVKYGDYSIRLCLDAKPPFGVIGGDGSSRAVMYLGVFS